ncbi:predicted protein [Streptomyces pristinaespiralis ATCC 25486]|uniref:Predicted protein n=1 Tax=Streptomyces pristinaespiralis (strain ATCC 25486 / DSM 40338 / CBS 914.69 / JCM 4507 / KCC S-0507 / NBRC 13074 / NRRL 2958 / 5647) TaxID=457429 RepID=B5H6W9_STRE2|nr:predicted protein [Streptomyces pristinaespiralis ATCC 25486]
MPKVRLPAGPPAPPTGGWTGTRRSRPERHPVLNHRGRGARAAKRWKAAQRGCSGRLLVGEDLLQPPAVHRGL